MTVTDPPRGAPSAAAAIIVPDGECGKNPASYLNNTIFIGKIGSGKMHEKNLNAHQVFLAPHALRFLSEGLPHREEIQPPVKSTAMVTIHV